MIPPQRRLVSFLLVAGPSLLALTAYLLMRTGKEELPTRRQADDPRTLVNRATQKGLTYLQSVDWGLAVAADNVNDVRRQEAIGSAALVGLALMARETPQSPDVIRRIRTQVLKAAPTLTRTEPVCWSIIFLKRRGEPDDDQVIATLTLRLAGCQYPNGCWAEEVAVLIPAQEKAWTRWYGHRKDQARLSPGETLERFQRPPPWRQRVHFALLALWYGRQHLPPGALNYASLLTTAQFDTGQRADGGWGEIANAPSDALATCAGLMAGAVRRHADAEIIDRIGKNGVSESTAIPLRKLQDREVTLARDYLTTAVQDDPSPAILWALAQVATAYGWNEANGWDWRGWGTNELLKTQQADGSWQVDGDKARPTALAILFINGHELFKASPTPQVPSAPLGEGQPKDDPKEEQQARAKRMERLTPKALEEYWKDTHPVIRLAAARAVKTKELDTLMECLPSFFDLLDDTDREVKDAAYASLKVVTRQDHGRSVKAWKEWWEKERKK